MGKTPLPLPVKLLCVAIFLFAAIAANAQEFTVGILKYKVTDSNNLCVAVTDCTDKSVTSLDIPEKVIYNETEYSVTGIASLPNMKNVTTFEMPDCITTVGDWGMQGWTSLTSIKISENLTQFPLGFLRYSSHLTSIHIPAKVSRFRGGSLQESPNLREITVDPQNPYFCSVDGVLYNKSKTTLVFFPEGKGATYRITVPIDTIGEGAFAHNKTITQLTIPSTVNYMGNDALYYTTSMSQVTFLSLPPLWGDLAIITHYEDGTEWKVKARFLETIKREWAGLEQHGFGFTYESLPEEETREFHSGGLTFGYMDDEAHTVCIEPNDYSSLTSVVLPEVVRNGYISYTLTRINHYAFKNCTTLTDIVIPATVDNLGIEAFAGCTNLATATLLRTTPPAKNGSLPATTTLLVPDESVDAYKSSEVWKDYTIYGKDMYGKSITLSKDIEAARKQMPGNWSNHGVLTDAAQLSTNKQEETEGPIANLIDGNTDTYFQSTRTTANAGNETHYLQADLRTALQFIRIKYEQSNATNAAEPKMIRVAATNDPAGAWTDIATGLLDDRTGNTLIDLGAPYRYVRFYVERTFSGYTEYGNLCFNWSELGIWNAANMTEELSSALNSEFSEIAAATEPSEALNSKMETAMQKLIRGNVLHLSDDGFSHAYGEAPTDMELVDFTRNYPNDAWQSLYLPFEVPFSELSEHFDAAFINNMHQYDEDADGTVDRTELEIIYFKEGDVLAANTPYLIKAKTPGRYTIAKGSVTMQPMADHSIDCASTRVRYTFTGSYNILDGATMAANHYYALSGGSMMQTESADAHLNAFRWHMKAENRSGSMLALPKRINIVEKGEGETTGIANDLQSVTNKPECVYDLNGRLVSTDGLGKLSKGVYIKGGRKIIK